MAKNKLTKILTSPDKDIKKTFGANGVLSRLFRQMLLDLNIGPARFGSLLQEYIIDPRNGVPNNKKDQTSQRGNLTKEFSRPQMTWKVFCKALRFMQITKIEFVIKAYHGDGKTTSLHSTVVDFGGPLKQSYGDNAGDLANGPYGVPYIDKPIGHAFGASPNTLVITPPAPPPLPAYMHYPNQGSTTK